MPCPGGDARDAPPGPATAASPGETPGRGTTVARAARPALLLLLAACQAALPPRAAPRPVEPPPERTEAPAPGDASLERAVIAELNRMRSDPAGYAEVLDDLLPLFRGNVMHRPGSRVGMLTREGPAAVREAAAALRATSPLPLLRQEDGLSDAAREHARDQGPRGLTGHTGTDGSSTADRVGRHGTWLRRLSESIEFGSETGRLVVLMLTVDDGVPGRGHRRNLLDREVATVGVGCGPHARYGRMCVIVLAGEYVTR